MARKRMLDPCIWDSEQVQTLTPAQFKLFIFMISQSDDEGRLKVSLPLFKSRVHPLTEYSPETFKSDVAELVKSGLMQSYQHGSEWYMAHPNWKKYQTINRPLPSRLPEPEKAEITDDSLNTHVGINED